MCKWDFQKESEATPGEGVTAEQTGAVVNEKRGSLAAPPSTVAGGGRRTTHSKTPRCTDGKARDRGGTLLVALKLQGPRLARSHCK